MAEREDGRLFSVDEVDELIPRLELIIEKLQRNARELRRSFELLAEERHCGVAELDVPDLLRRWPEKRAVLQELEELVGEIGECGGQFKGIDLGLVDFPAEIDGQVVLLCWQYGEKEVAHWHSMEGGFAARRPLPREARATYLQ
jgi:hypothetical protein